MIRECTETDREILESYLEEDSYGQAIFHLIDEFGFEQKFQSVYMDIEEEQCKGVYLMIYKNVLLYSKENQVEIDFLEQMLSVLVPEMVIGRKDNVNIVQLIGHVCDAYAFSDIKMPWFVLLCENKIQCANLSRKLKASQSTREAQVIYLLDTDYDMTENPLKVLQTYQFEGEAQRVIGETYCIRDWF